LQTPKPLIGEETMMKKPHEMTRRELLAAGAVAAGTVAAGAVAWPALVCRADEGKPDLQPVPDQELERIKAALPAAPTAQPKAKRRVLVFYRCDGFVHGSINRCNAALELMGDKTGAYETVVSKDMQVFDPGFLKDFDVVLFNNTTQLAFDDARHRAALMDFIRGGRGVCGIHAATDNFNNWPEAAEMMGGLFDGHPWGGGGTWAVQIEEPDHPINKAFGGQGFWVNDEIYKLKAPYSRERQRILLGLDMTKPENKPGRPDGDNAIAWIRNFGDGRVFYCSLGHNNHIFWTPAILQHYLDGIQFALGDLPADATPSALLDAKPKVCPAPAA
jgi:type 1 glutamine amidotransferase